MMFTRRKACTTAVAAHFLATCASAHAQTLENGMASNRKSAPGGPANRSLAALERSWVETRFYSEAMMEEGRIPRDVWADAKLNVIHGNFDIRDPDNGELLQKAVNGVRLPPAP
jgi:hypothetical protein